MKPKRVFTLLIFALIGWVCCAAIMGIGMRVLTVETTLIIHLIGAPIIFTIISLVYFKKYNFTSPLQTAVFFVFFIIVVDFFVVALLINKSFEMFTSPIGTWIPFVLIFLSTYITGMFAGKKPA